MTTEEIEELRNIRNQQIRQEVTRLVLETHPEFDETEVVSMASQIASYVING